MANPFSLIIAGVDSGANLLDLPAPSATTTPYVDLASVSMTLSADGSPGAMNFTVIEPKTPSGNLPWWRSGAVYDSARVQFFDSRYHATTPLFLGYISNIDGEILENGVGTRATVQVTGVTGWLQSTIVRNGKTGIRATSFVDSFTIGVGEAGDTTATTDRDIIDGLLKRVAAQQTDASTLQLLNTAVISGTTRAAIYSSNDEAEGVCHLLLNAATRAETAQRLRHDGINLLSADVHGGHNSRCAGSTCSRRRQGNAAVLVVHWI